MDSTTPPAGVSTPKKRLLKSGWFWASMVVLVVGLVVTAFNAIEGYYFPCAVTGNISGRFTCDAPTGARVVAAIKNSTGGICGMMCFYIALFLAYCVKLAKAKPPTEAGAEKASTEADQPPTEAT